MLKEKNELSFYSLRRELYNKNIICGLPSPKSILIVRKTLDKSQ